MDGLGEGSDPLSVDKAWHRQQHWRRRAGASGVGMGLFAVPQITHERRSDGSIVLRSARGLGPVPRSIGVLLERWAAAAPDRVFLAERAASGAWRHLTYEAAGR